MPLPTDTFSVNRKKNKIAYTEHNAYYECAVAYKGYLV